MVQRNQLSDGTLVPGFAFPLGDPPSRDFKGFPAGDRSKQFADGGVSRRRTSTKWAAELS
jgi:hypothetical protein